MNLKKLLIPAITVSLLAVSAQPAARAQDEAAEEDPQLAGEELAEEAVFEDIVVTATKREENIFEVPLAISAFTSETIEEMQINDLIDIGKFVPNLNVTAFSAGHTSSANVFIRGIGLQDHLIATDPGVGVYVDGVYLGRQVG
ncbi:MAG: TonB-dependent receptor plug domain-containing protein, partial [Thermoanaerobaculia bacterium]